MKKQIITITIVLSLFIMTFVYSDDLLHYTNPVFDFDYEPTWEHVMGGNLTLYTQESDLIFSNDDKKTIVFISILDEKDFQEFGNPDNMPFVNIISEYKSELFGIPARKYKFIIDEDDFTGLGEVIISDVSNNNFYRLTLLSEEEFYPSFIINGEEISEIEVEKGTFDDEPLQEEKNGFFSWLFGLIKSVISSIA
ncbi:MAG: hypothetical protein ABII01_01655 [Candidatus Woesearchaeota archaeon]